MFGLSYPAYYILLVSFHSLTKTLPIYYVTLLGGRLTHCTLSDHPYVHLSICPSVLCQHVTQEQKSSESTKLKES